MGPGIALQFHRGPDRNQPRACRLRARSRRRHHPRSPSLPAGKLNYIPLMIIALAAILVLARHLVALIAGVMGIPAFPSFTIAASGGSGCGATFSPERVPAKARDPPVEPSHSTVKSTAVDP